MKISSSRPTRTRTKSLDVDNISEDALKVKPGLQNPIPTSNNQFLSPITAFRSNSVTSTRKSSDKDGSRPVLKRRLSSVDETAVLAAIERVSHDSKALHQESVRSRSTSLNSVVPSLAISSIGERLAQLAQQPISVGNDGRKSPSISPRLTARRKSPRSIQKPTGTFSPCSLPPLPNLSKLRKQGKILVRVFNYLSIEFRIHTLCSVTKQIRSLALNPSIYRRLNVKSSPERNLSYFLSTFASKTTQLVLSAIIPVKVVETILDQIGKQLIVLDISQLCLPPTKKRQSLEFVFSMCHNLKSISFNTSQFTAKTFFTEYNKLEKLMKIRIVPVPRESVSRYMEGFDMRLFQYHENGSNLKTLDCWFRVDGNCGNLKEISETSNVETLSIVLSNETPDCLHDLHRMYELKSLTIALDDRQQLRSTPFKSIAGLNVMLEHLSIQMIDQGYAPLIAPKLESISMQTNLQSLEFIGISKLCSVDLSNCSQLTSLRIMNCKFLSFATFSVEKLTNLTVLEIESCSISEVPKGLEELSRLRKLNLSKNRISNIADVIILLTELIEIDLSYNTLSYVQSLHRLTKLSVLNLLGNSLKSVPVVSSGVVHLLLDSEGMNGRIDNIDVLIAGNLNQLEKLALAGHLLKTIPREIGYMTQLRVINLKNCRIETIPENSLEHLTCLQELYLNGNQLQDFTLNTEKTKCMKILNIMHNPIYHDLVRSYTLTIPESECKKHVDNILKLRESKPQDSILYTSLQERFTINFILHLQNYLNLYLMWETKSKSKVSVHQGFASIHLFSGRIESFEEVKVVSKETFKDAQVQTVYDGCSKRRALSLPKYNKLKWIEF